MEDKDIIIKKVLALFDEEDLKYISSINILDINQQKGLESKEKVKELKKSGDIHDRQRK